MIAARAMEIAMSRAESPSPLDTISTAPTRAGIVFTLPSFCTTSHEAFPASRQASKAARMSARKGCMRSLLIAMMMKATLTARTTKGQ
jgi:hypothetical protein